MVEDIFIGLGPGLLSHEVVEKGNCTREHISLCYFAWLTVIGVWHAGYYIPQVSSWVAMGYLTAMEAAPLLLLEGLALTVGGIWPAAFFAHGITGIETSDATRCGRSGCERRYLQ
jgi:hypothetical protein